jgi:hypothetical protein
MFKITCDKFNYLIVIDSSFGDEMTRKLFKHLVSDYHNLVRPVYNDTETVNVALGLKISRIIDMVNLKFWVLKKTKF